MVAPIPTAVLEPYEELDVTESIGEDGRFRASCQLKTTWARRLALADQLLGMQMLPAGEGNSAVVIIPAEYPHRLGTFVKAITSIVGFPRTNPDYDKSGAATQSRADYKDAVLTVEYETPLFSIANPDGTPRVSESLEPTAEFRTLPVKDLYWDDGLQSIPLDELEAPSKVVRKIDWVYEISGLTTLPSGTISLIGHVNSNPITSSFFGYTFGAETLLYHPPVLRRFWYSAHNAAAWDASFRFTHDPENWNLFDRGGRDTRQAVYKQANNQQFRPYKLGNFNSIII